MITTKTALYAVFGDPVAHSLGPIMHNRVFHEIGHDGVYVAFRVTDIRDAMVAVRALGITGVSITIPHKTTVLKYLDEVDPAADRIGAVNTVVNRNGVLTGYNSDGMGAVRALKDKTKIGGKTVAVLGAGGAARAIAAAIKSENGIPVIVNRTVARGERLAHDLGTRFRPLAQIGELGFDILVNTTPVGMHPETNQMPVPENVLKPGRVVMDIVYNPLQTHLLQQAARAGCGTVDGIAMFVYQGAYQLELWTGEKAPLRLMRRTVLEELQAKTTQESGSRP